MGTLVSSRFLYAADFLGSIALCFGGFLGILSDLPEAEYPRFNVGNGCEGDGFNWGKCTEHTRLYFKSGSHLFCVTGSSLLTSWVHFSRRSASFGM